MNEPMRLDAALVRRGFAGGRDRAKQLIAEGAVTVNGAVAKKASVTVGTDDEIACSVTSRFVGRGGEKLLKVLENTALDVSGAVCADIGASTGGFTDCLLQHGACRVYAVDVGHDQLAQTLRDDPRVVCMERTDVRRRDAVGEHITDGSIDICTVDVSFISLTQIWDSLLPLLKPNGKVVCLIKPQFEAGRAALNKHGVVRREQDHVRVLNTLLCFWQEQQVTMSYLSWSPVRGGEGNIEYVAVLSTDGAAADMILPETVVRDAFAAFRSQKSEN